MNRHRSAVRLFLIAATALTLSTSAFAQATRTWVSSVGDDANPCSRTAPCKTFAGAYSHTATDGEMDVIDNGAYGGVTLGRAMTINGRGTLASILGAGGNGITVNTTGRVVIRDIQITGAGTGFKGINVISVGTLEVSNVDIYGFTQHGIMIGTSVTPKVEINDSHIYSNGAAGANGITSLPVAQGVNLTVNNCVISNNNNDGIYVGQNTYAMIRDCSISANGRGVHVEQNIAATTRAFLVDTVLTQNGTGLRTGIGAVNVTLTRTNIEGNNIGLDQTSGTLFSYGGNSISGNNSNNTATTSPVMPQ